MLAALLDSVNPLPPTNRTNGLMTDASESSFSAARDLVERLGAEIAADDGAPPRLIETHISWVLLGRTHAYKFKKPLRLPFLDFTTLAERRRFCEEELRLNRRLAPDLYLDVVAVRDGPARTVASTAPGGCSTSRCACAAFPTARSGASASPPERCVAADIDAFARRLAACIASAARAAAHGGFGAPAIARAGRRVARSPAIEPGRRSAGPAAAVEWPALRQAGRASVRCSRAALGGAAPLGGAMRECHGDLHLANVVQLGEASRPRSTAIEFDPALRWLDVLDDAGVPGDGPAGPRPARPGIPLPRRVSRGERRPRRAACIALLPGLRARWCGRRSACVCEARGDRSAGRPARATTCAWQRRSR